jgi:hypothetical protein
VWPVMVVAVGAALAGPAAAQTAEGPVRVFLDCQTRGCDDDEFRTEIGFVDWVRESTAADVHVIVTSQGTGAGREFVFDFVGRGELAGADLRVPASVPATFTRDEELARLTRTLKAGLVSYAARRGQAARLEIREVEEEAGSASQTEDDPWNLWVFSLGTDVEASGEEQQNRWEVGARASANRITEEWKIDVGLDGEVARREVELSEGTFVNETEEWRFDVLAVKSLSPHWSAGGEVELDRSTRRNRDVGGRVAAAFEWNYYPYREANRRQFLVHYQIGFSVVDYEQITIFEVTRDELFDQRLAVVYQNRQPWGDVSVGANWSNYLHDFSKYSLSGGLDANIRLFSGFELDLRASYERIRNQLYLSAAELSDEEIIAGRRELETGYEYGMEVGISYRFGSIYNNVVNNRFPWILWRF